MAFRDDVWCDVCHGERWIEDDDDFERCTNCGCTGLDREVVIDLLGLRSVLAEKRATKAERLEHSKVLAANVGFRRALAAIRRMNDERTEAPKMEPRVEGGKVVFDLVPDDLSTRMAHIADRALYERGRLDRD